MSTGLVIRRIRPGDYARLDDSFAALSARAAEPNPAMSPAAVTAAQKRVAEGEIVILAAWLSEALGSERLAGIWTLRRRRDWRSGFSRVLTAPLLPLYEVCSAPVLDRDHADDIARAMLRHILAASDLPRVLALPLLPLEGAGFRSLQNACLATASRISIFETWQRPVAIPEPGDDAERYLRRALGSGYKKRMQQFRAIARQGAVALQRRRGAPARDALESFLTLEAAGWKGKAGTAIACLPDEASYFRELADRLAARDMLQVDALLLDGAPIAMGLLIDSAGTRQFIKIAYDEGQARLSPGRALTIAMLQADFAGSPPAFFDSGAGDAVDAGTYVWGERRLMGHAILHLGSAARGLPHLAAAARMALRRLRDRLQR